MHNIETYQSEDELLGRIEQLKIDGIQEESITVISKNPLEKASFGYTNINIKSAEGTAWDKIVSFFSSDNSEDRVIAGLDLDNTEEQKFKDELDRGNILLYVNRESSGAIAKEPVTDDTEDTVQPDEQTREDAANMTAAGTAGASGVAGVTAHDDIADKTGDGEGPGQDISRENDDNVNQDDGTASPENTSYKETASGAYDDPNEDSSGQIHNPANKEGVTLDKTREAHDHSSKLVEDDEQLAYGEGTDEHIAVDPSVKTDKEETDAEKIEHHKEPDYLKNSRDDFDFGNKDTVINEYKMDDRRNQHLVDTHNHPELAEEVSPEERESSEEDNHELIDKNPDGKDRDYSFKKDVDGEQVIRIDDEEQ